MNLKQLWQLWKQTHRHLHKVQREIIQDIIYGRANETSYHHKLLVQVAPYYFNEKEIFLMRKILYFVTKKFEKKNKEIVIDCYFDLTEISRKNPLATLYVFTLSGKSYTCNIGRWYDLELAFDVLKTKKNLKYMKVNFPKGDVLRFWGAKTFEQLSQKYFEFYRPVNRLNYAEEINKRKKEMRQRYRYIDSIDFETRIFIKKDGYYSTSEYIDKRINEIKQLNKGPHKRDAINYIRYGIKWTRMDIMLIDIVYYHFDHEETIWVLSDGTIYFNHFMRARAPDFINLKELAEKGSAYHLKMRAAYGMEQSEILKYYREKWGTIG